MTVNGIVKEYLAKNGYDGLCNDDCGCGLDDLAPCDNMSEDCMAAYRCECENCQTEYDCDIVFSAARCSNAGKEKN
jgi:hypothetical protein